jgi:predicted HicB family RNase H-like nuclease
VDLDIKMVPEHDALFRAIPALKEKLEVNVELASPADFIPELPGWQERSRFIVREGKIDFFHYDFYSQALSKLQRGHGKDLEDVQEMIERKLVEPRKATELFEAIEGQLYRFPAIDPASFRRRVEAALQRR